MAGIKEVAAEAGVSTATVSRALRGLEYARWHAANRVVQGGGPTCLRAHA